jgi:hypothetical protein
MGIGFSTPKSCEGVVMISVTEFHKQWAERHDFEYDDADFLSKKFPNILFKNIPQAWVCCIYDHLYLIEELPKVFSILQVFGFPVINYENNIADDDFHILKDMENSILCIDVDLHKQLEAIILN